MNIYLDINGVILDGYKPAYLADEFLAYVCRHWPDTTYWLSSFAWQGKEHVTELLRPILKPKTIQIIQTIQLAKWRELKTEGINFKKPFLWFDDNLFSEERKILEHYSALRCHRLINLQRDPTQLMDELVYLKSLV